MITEGSSLIILGFRWRKSFQKTRPALTLRLSKGHLSHMKASTRKNLVIHCFQAKKQDTKRKWVINSPICQDNSVQPCFKEYLEWSSKITRKGNLKKKSFNKLLFNFMIEKKERKVSVERKRKNFIIKLFQISF